MLSATTELDAVNAMLRCINEAPVSTLSGWSGSSDVAKAIAELREVSSEMQSQGWSFNTDLNLTLTPDGSGKLAIPTGAIRVEVSRFRYSDLCLIMRDGFMYDTISHTDVINKTVVADKVVYGLDFEKLPQTARRYITMKAARAFQDRVLGSEAVQRFSLNDEQRAWNRLLSDECRTNNVNIFKNPDVLGGIRYGNA